ncbi:UDP-N-acetylmuramoyl-L-alanyl-D-glutamate--2,6-diaminopimelate ligase [Fictibacillus enclensis]|uniref:UDP-N-acetylmuramoyl-L-alanyl-D-glutamate--2, 6-diaminopimelate ligase n=1 Tax=Fictibacillus enclensis TaxID=1017270 RepID=UPI0024C0A8D3|nr:UDP-N-acetylmuramoyl-L-alanyl-D-glutamate--2,6-diaminopimelate ligase [Fictibacillus enclensis]WHY74710.1 UDP-N-acetylmuramoyl-L-alanyl-D-glutamate--2,6-diaminopimelate ligase [Fictibacillus enclensis]
MKLDELLKVITITDRVNHLPSVSINAIQFNSKKIRPGDLFVAIKGFAADGHQYIQQAIDKGAVAVVGELPPTQLDVPYYQTPDSRKALAHLASQYYGHPYQNHVMIGITGTNGKTTTAYLLKHMIEKAGKTCSLIGTVHNIINNERIQSKNTTPDPLELQALLAESRDEVVIMEVSSHGIEQQRVEGILFDYALFTNLGHDHLDYHDSLEEYFNVKSRLFKQLKKNGAAVIASHNEWGRKLKHQIEATEHDVYTFGSDDRDDMKLVHVCTEYFPLIKLKQESLEYTFQIPLPGLHNVWNTIGALLTVSKMNLSLEKVIASLDMFPGVPGRFETYSHTSGATFIVDYAHTKDAIEYCYQTAKRENAERIVHILGFRGNRDVTKRSEIVSLCSSVCDQLILTFDDLNRVPEEKMISDLERLKENDAKDNAIVIPDRTKAIEYAWKEARAGDWVFVTGKGQETYKQKFQLPASNDKETIQFLQQERLALPY